MKAPLMLQLLTALVVLFGCKATLSDPDDIDDVNGNRKVYNDVVIIQQFQFESGAQLEYEGCPSIVAAQDGDIMYTAWYERGRRVPNQVTIAISLDKGKTWKNNQLVLQPNGATQKISDPALWQDHNGDIWLFFNSWPFDLPILYASRLTWDGVRIQYTDPVNIAVGIMLNKPAYVPEKNVALFPVSVWRHLDVAVFGNVQPGAFVRLFDYNRGKKDLDMLTPYSIVDGLADDLWDYDEHQVVQTSETGGFLCILRAKDGIHYANSTDYGKTWTPLAPFTATGLTTYSRFHISRLQSGNLLLILNDSATRTHMTAFLSEDGGETWPHRLLIDERRRVSYPDASQSADGIIHITYDRDRDGDRDILYLGIVENDIIQGNESNIQRIRINP